VAVRDNRAATRLSYCAARISNGTSTELTEFRLQQRIGALKETAPGDKMIVENNGWETRARRSDGRYTIT